MKNTIAKEFNFFSLLKFAFPTIVMMIILGLYTIVDSMFVSKFVGTNALSAINIIYPVINIIIALAIMIASGGSAIIARKIGDGAAESARENFSLLVVVGAIAGIVITILGIIFIKPIIYSLGASEILYQYCYDYLLIMLLFAPANILQMLFQTFFVTAGKPNIGLTLTIFAGLTNVVLDYIFIVPLGMGVQGAAIATGIGYMIPAIAGLVFFTNKKHMLHFAKPRFDKAVLWESCSNGSSEMVSNLSMGVTTFLFNIIMMKYLGEEGVAAITIILYAQFLLTALFMGFSMGVAPVISYNYGSQNIPQLRRIFKISMIFTGIASVAVFLASRILSSSIISIFSPEGTVVYEIAMAGFKLFPIGFFFAGFNIYASAMFTAFSNGKISAVISFMRTFVFIIAGLALLPMLFGVTGIWLAIPVAEFSTFALAAICMYKGGHRYNYL